MNETTSSHDNKDPRRQAYRKGLRRLMEQTFENDYPLEPATTEDGLRAQQEIREIMMRECATGVSWEQFIKNFNQSVETQRLMRRATRWDLIEKKTADDFANAALDYCIDQLRALSDPERDPIIQEKDQPFAGWVVSLTLYEINKLYGNYLIGREDWPPYVREWVEGWEKSAEASSNAG